MSYKPNEPNGRGWIAVAGLCIGLGLAEIGYAISDVVAVCK